MEIQIIAFGHVSDFLSNQRLTLSDITNTEELKIYLEERFPALSQMKYKLVLNKEIVQSPLHLSDRDTVAIMPPFSGG
jgi:molybdopterin synthase sulfur carrier subunit